MSDSQNVPAEATPETPPRFYASIYPPEQSLHPELGMLLAKLSADLGMPVWLLLQDDFEAPLSELNRLLVHMVRHDKENLVEGQKIALIINSPGGHAGAAYELARLINRRCGGFLAIVPDRAMRCCHATGSWGRDDHHGTGRRIGSSRRSDI